MIRGTKTRLRALERDDLPRSAGWFSDPEVRHFLAMCCYEKCGFRHEGTMRQARYSGGQYFDELMMAILRGEFLEEQKGEA